MSEEINHRGTETRRKQKTKFSYSRFKISNFQSHILLLCVSVALWLISLVEVHLQLKEE